MARDKLSTLRRRGRAGGARAAEAAAGRIEPLPANGASTAAFFDLDNTLIRGAALFHLARGLAARGELRFRDVVRFGRHHMAFRVRGEHAVSLEDTRDAALSFIAGRSVADLRGLCESVYEDYLAERVWAGTRDLAEAHLRAGQPVWLVTAAPSELADTVARRLGLTGALGTVSETDEGYYTGRLSGSLLHGAAKAEAVRELADRLGLDLDQCHAYSDSANDLPLLSLVGHPVAINPDTRLGRHARTHGWRIVEHRTARRAARHGITRVLVGAVLAVLLGRAALRQGRRTSARTTSAHPDSRTNSRADSHANARAHAWRHRP